MSSNISGQLRSLEPVNKRKIGQIYARNPMLLPQLDKFRTLEWCKIKLELAELPFGFV